MNETEVREISAREPDWSRERSSASSWEPSKALLRTIRDYQRARGRGAKLAARWAALRHRFWSVITGADIPLDCQIGGGLLLPHPNGVVIHPGSRIGVNCLIFQQVTIGSTERGIAELGGHVDVGAGAKVLGPITIGNHVKIGANSVVTIDVPDGATVVGIPARIVQD